MCQLKTRKENGETEKADVIITCICGGITTGSSGRCKRFGTVLMGQHMITSRTEYKKKGTRLDIISADIKDCNRYLP